jgi:hypothetical protein
VEYTREHLTFPLKSSLGLEPIMKENLQLSYQSVAQLFPQLLALERGQEQPDPPPATQPHTQSPHLKVALPLQASFDSRDSNTLQVGGRESGSEYISLSPVLDANMLPGNPG